MTRAMNAPPYEMTMTMVAIINIWSIVVRDLLSYDLNYVYGWCFIQIFLNIILLFEVIIDYCSAGSLSLAFSTKFRVGPETICQILNVYATGFLVIVFLYNESLLKTLKYFEAIIFIRQLKALPLLYELQIMRVIIETIRNLMAPLASLGVVVIAIFYWFAVIGMGFFGGKVHADVPAIENNSSLPGDMVFMNFNDVISSFVT